MFTQRAPAATQSMPEAAAGPCSSSGAETVLWADKHTPHCLEDLRLSMHQKKVQQMHEWLQAQLPHNFRRDFCRLMIITGKEVVEFKSMLPRIASGIFNIRCR